MPKKILIVDDEPIIVKDLNSAWSRTIMKRILLLTARKRWLNLKRRI